MGPQSVAHVQSSASSEHTSKQCFQTMALTAPGYATPWQGIARQRQLTVQGRAVELALLWPPHSHPEVPARISKQHLPLLGGSGCCCLLACQIFTTCFTFLARVGSIFSRFWTAYVPSLQSCCMSCCVTFRAAVSRIWARTSAKHLTQLPHSRRLQQTSQQAISRPCYRASTAFNCASKTQRGNQDLRRQSINETMHNKCPNSTRPNNGSICLQLFASIFITSWLAIPNRCSSV